MADEQITVEERAARMLADDLKTLPRLVKQMRGLAYGLQNLSPERELWAWGFQDETVDVAALRQQGIPDADIARQRFPLRQHLVRQAGTTFEEQQRYSDRLAARWVRAQAEGRQPRPPERPPSRLGHSG